MSDFDRIEFRTLDRILLRGNFFRAAEPKSPVVVMTQGLTLLKEHYIDDTARRFRAAGISALVYDHRGFGSSEGRPRHEVDPHRQADDYHDAVTAAMCQPGVDPARIAIWGIGHSGGASMMAAADDPRIKAVILNMPFVSGALDAAGFPAGILDQAWRDREAVVASRDAETSYVKPWPLSHANAIGAEGPSPFLRGEDAWTFFSGAAERSMAAGTPWDNRMSLQSFAYIARSEPKDFISKIAPRALLYLAAEQDPLTAPLETHRKVFANAANPNAEFAVLTPHHLATYFGDAFERSVEVQIDFLKRKL